MLPHLRAAPQPWQREELLAQPQSCMSCVSQDIATSDALLLSFPSPGLLSANPNLILRVLCFA